VAAEVDRKRQNLALPDFLVEVVAVEAEVVRLLNLVAQELLDKAIMAGQA
jgi:hypothetical protein